jgi:hypothetical protein
VGLAARGIALVRAASGGTGRGLGDRLFPSRAQQGTRHCAEPRECRPANGVFYKATSRGTLVNDLQAVSRHAAFGETSFTSLPAMAGPPAFAASRSARSVPSGRRRGATRGGHRPAHERSRSRRRGGARPRRRSRLRPGRCSTQRRFGRRGGAAVGRHPSHRPRGNLGHPRAAPGRERSRPVGGECARRLPRDRRPSSGAAVPLAGARVLPAPHASPCQR